MSIIQNAEKYMKRYDYLINKRERKYREGKRLSKEEDEELRQLQPNVFTPIFMMFELLHDTVKTNQQHRQLSNRIKNQTGGATPSLANTSEIVDAATAAAAVVASQKLKSQGSTTETTPSKEAEARRLSELEESLLPLLTKIIIYIEENKKAEKKKHGDGEEGREDEKYPDIGTSAKNSAILVVRRIKKWWNDLVSGGTSDISSKINLKKMIPQLANNPDDMNNLINIDEMNKFADKATDAIHGPLQKIERILSNDVRDIASSSVEGIMNALSLIPGIGTTLQLWRLLQNVIVIMSKSVSTMGGVKETGGELKVNAQGLADEFQKMTDPNVLANAAANRAMKQIPGGGDPSAALAALTSGGAGGVMGAINGAGGTEGLANAFKGAGGAEGLANAFKGAGGTEGLANAFKGAGGTEGLANAFKGAGGAEGLANAFKGAGGAEGLANAFKGAGGAEGLANAFKGAGGAEGLANAFKGAGGAEGLANAFKGAGGTEGLANAFKGAGGDAVKQLKAGGLNGAMDALKGVGGDGMKGGGAPRKTNHLRSIKKYKREYKQSIREIRKTRKNILRCIKNMI
jgi:hypothetical protein